MTGAPTLAPVLEPQPQGLSYSARIINVFIAPTKTFTDLKRKSGWLVPFVLIAVVSVFFVWAVDAKIGFDKATENQLKLNPKQMERMEKLSPEDREKQFDMQVKGTKYFSYAFPVVYLIMMLVIAALYLGTFNFGLGAQLKFGTVLAVIMYASVPSILRSLLAVVTLFAGVDPDGFMMQNPVATNLGALVDPVAHRTLYSFGSNVDIFAIWGLILTGIGFACVTKVKRGTALAVVFGWYFVFMLLMAGLTLLF
jgi:Yip1 domain